MLNQKTLEKTDISQWFFYAYFYYLLPIYIDWSKPSVYYLFEVIIS